MSNNSFKHFDHSSMKDEDVRLNDEQFNVLKEIYVERLVDNMSTKDLAEYVADDLFNYFDKLGEHEFLDEAKNYWDDMYDDVVQELIEDTSS